MHAFIIYTWNWNKNIPIRLNWKTLIGDNWRLYATFSSSSEKLPVCADSGISDCDLNLKNSCLRCIFNLSSPLFMKCPLLSLFPFNWVHTDKSRVSKAITRIRFMVGLVMLAPKHICQPSKLTPISLSSPMMLCWFIDYMYLLSPVSLESIAQHANLAKHD